MAGPAISSRDVRTPTVAPPEAPARLTNTEPGLLPAWHVVATSAELDAAGGLLPVRLLGKGWVLARLDEVIAALPDRCPHRRVPLSAGRIVGRELECCYHGWRFAADGHCTAIPALGATEPPSGMRVRPAHAVVERYGLVWLAPEQPLTPFPELPECEDPAYQWSVLPPRRTRVSAGVVIDNFFDVAHFSYLHSETFGITEPVTLADATFARDGWQARLVHATRLRESAGGEQRVATYTMTAPFAMHLGLLFPATGEHQMVAFVAQPEDASTTVVYKLVALPRTDAPDALAAVERFEVQVLEEDLAVLELIEDPALVLDLHGELHTKADRASIELRRILADLCVAATG